MHVYLKYPEERLYMKYNNTESVTDLLNSYLRQEGLESPLYEYRLMASWPVVVGDVINRYTKNLIIRNQVLFVELKSPVVRQELMMQREELIRKLNKETGATVITDIKFR